MNRTLIAGIGLFLLSTFCTLLVDIDTAEAGRRGRRCRCSCYCDGWNGRGCNGCYGYGNGNGVAWYYGNGYRTASPYTMPYRQVDPAYEGRSVLREREQVPTEVSPEEESFDRQGRRSGGGIRY